MRPVNVGCVWVTMLAGLNRIGPGAYDVTPEICGLPDLALSWQVLRKLW